MLSDRERATLSEIQRQFVAEDPRYVQGFDAHALVAVTFFLARRRGDTRTPPN